MQSAVDEKKKLELRLDNITGELNKAKAHAAELEGSRQQLQVGWRHGVGAQLTEPRPHNVCRPASTSNCSSCRTHA
jgi:hypothetical protein